MSAFLGLLVFAFFIAFIVGMVKPSLVLRWSKKPTRLKVFGFWILFTFIIAMVGGAIDDKEDRDKLAQAQKYISEENYSKAITTLENIEKEDSSYTKAQVLITKVDSLSQLSDEEKRLAKEKAAKKKREEQILNQKEQLQREVESIENGVGFSKYRGSVENLQLELVLFGSWADLINSGEKSENSDVVSLSKRLRLKVESIQKREFPKMRSEYAEIMSDKLWENDIDVYANGSGKRYINLTGGLFAANKNKKDFQEQLHEILTLFRFKQARYRWFDGAEEYTYWDVYKGNDSDLVTFDQ